MDMQIVRRGTPPPPPWGDDIPYYWEGEEFFARTGGWVVGVQQEGSTATKEIDHLILFARGTASTSSQVSFTTDNKVNLSNISILYIDWENTGDNSTSNSSRFLVGNTKDSTSGEFETRIVVERNFARKIDILDVSSLNGEYYIRVFTNDSTGTSNPVDSETKVYRVWGEK